MGRPAIEITPEICKKAELMAARGLTMTQIADALGMHYDTLNEKKKEFSEFSEAIKRGQAKGIGTITNCLFERAIGYSHPEDKIFCNKDGEVTTVETMKHWAPDTTAQIFYLKNRAGWKDSKDVKHSGNITHEHEGISRTLEILREFRGLRSAQPIEGPVQN